MALGDREAWSWAEANLASAEVWIERLDADFARARRLVA